MLHWGIHTALNLRKCCPHSIRSPQRILAFSNALVKAIDMKQHGPAQIIHFGEDDKKGFTLITLLTTSNIAAHFSEDLDAAFIECFSCKHYEPATVERVAREFFKPSDCERVVMYRGEGANYPLIC